MENLDTAVLRALRDWRAAGQQALLVTVVRTWGSSPRPVGSIMALCEDGAVMGSVSGGCVEGAVYELAQEVVAAGAKEAASPKELAEASDYIITCVTGPEDVKEVVLGPGGVIEGAKPGSVVIDMSTISPEATRAIAAALAEKQVHMLDAPVSGGFMGAADGTLAIMVGGDKAAYSTAKPVLKQMGTLVMHLGEIGSGTKAKLARNLLHFISFAAVTEAQQVAEASGIDLVKLGQIVRHSDAVTGGPGAIMHRDRTGPLAEDDFWHGVFAHVWALGDKDLTLAMELAASEGIDTPLAKLAHQILPIGLGLEEAHE